MRHKILYISSWFPNKLEPTNGNFVQRHAEASSLFNDVEILHTIGNPNQEEKFVFDEKIINGIRTLIVYYQNTENSVRNFVRRMKAYKLGFKKMQKPDLVHANVLHNNLLFAVWLKKRHHIPFVVTEHWTALQEENLIITSKKIIKIAKIIGNEAEIILPVSQNLMQSLKKIGIETPMKVVTNVVDTDLFRINNEARNEVVNFLHISNLIPRKKAEKIIETAERLHKDGYKFILNIGGDGDLQKITELVKKLNAENYIKIFGGLSYLEVSKKMQESDCFILFSENETQGCVILESFACGKPVISTKVGGVPEFLKENYGLLIEKNNTEQLYEAMKNFIENKLIIDTPENMRSYVVENFSKESIARQFTEIYDEVLNK